MQDIFCENLVSATASLVPGAQVFVSIDVEMSDFNERFLSHRGVGGRISYPLTKAHEGRKTDVSSMFSNIKLAKVAQRRSVAVILPPSIVG